jgi:hypothetical protein
VIDREQTTLRVNGVHGSAQRHSRVANAMIDWCVAAQQTRVSAVGGPLHTGNEQQMRMPRLRIVDERRRRDSVVIGNVQKIQRGLCFHKRGHLIKRGILICITRLARMRVKITGIPACGGL